MISTPLSVLSLILTALIVLLLLGGGITILVVGKARGVPSGLALFILALGTIGSSLLGLFLPAIQSALGVGSASSSAILSIVQLVTSIVGWGLLIFALLRFRAERPAAPTGPAGPAAPGPGPLPGYPGAPPPYGPPPGQGPPPGRTPPPGPGTPPGYGPSQGYGPPPAG